jgi:leucyl-tRNA synthetase
LIDKKKFDFRLYVLVTQVTPELHCFLYNDGLARFATEDYSKNTNDDNLFMHLTNYAINKESEKFQQNESDYKKSLLETMETIRELEGEEAVTNLMVEIKDILIKTLLIGWPHLDHNYKTCCSKLSNR